MRPSVARISIAICIIILIVSPLVMCACPGLFAIMAVCTIVAFICGSRDQRIISTVLLLIAVAGFVFELREVRHTALRLQQMKDRILHLREP